VTLLSPAGRSNEHHGDGCVLLVYGTMARRRSTVYTPNARQNSNERMAGEGGGGRGDEMKQNLLISEHTTDLRESSPPTLR
jgi:hypothetical protein